MMGRRGGWADPLLFVLLGACGGSGSSGPPQLELGTGVDHFEPLALEGDTLHLVRGMQGGYHIYGAVRLRGIKPRDKTLRYGVTDAETGAALTYPRGVVLTEGRYTREDDAFIRVGDTLVFDVDRPEDIVGREVVVDVLLEGADPPLADARLLTLEGVLP